MIITSSLHTIALNKRTPLSKLMIVPPRRINRTKLTRIRQKRTRRGRPTRVRPYQKVDDILRRSTRIDRKMVLRTFRSPPAEAKAATNRRYDSPDSYDERQVGGAISGVEAGPSAAVIGKLSLLARLIDLIAPMRNRADRCSMMAISRAFATASLSKERLEPAVLVDGHAQVTLRRRYSTIGADKPEHLFMDAENTSLISAWIMNKGEA
jgi:hypothetical protein